jgi:RNA-directed DNA polymerase
MSKIRKGFTRKTKNPACPLAVGGYESFREPRNRQRLMSRGFLRLIGRYLRCGVVVNGRLNQTSKGVPQGSPLSPMLSNILLDDLDKELERRGHRFARYADDLIILTKSQRAAYRVMASISRFLEKKLKVKVNKDKSRVVCAQDSCFLGFTFPRMKLTATEKAIHGFKTRLRRLTGRSWGVSMSYRYVSLSRYIQGWMNYFGVGMKYNDVVELDHWLRRRIRTCGRPLFGEPASIISFIPTVEFFETPIIRCRLIITERKA